MASRYYFDTRLLRDHVSELNDERRTAQRLRESVRAAKNYGDPAIAQSYNRVLYSVDEMVRYFEKMADALENAASEATKLYRELGVEIQESTGRLHAENDKLML